MIKLNNGSLFYVYSNLYSFQRSGVLGTQQGSFTHGFHEKCFISGVFGVLFLCFVGWLVSWGFVCLVFIVVG